MFQAKYRNHLGSAKCSNGRPCCPPVEGHGITRLVRLGNRMAYAVQKPNHSPEKDGRFKLNFAVNLMDMREDASTTIVTNELSGKAT